MQAWIMGNRNFGYSEAVHKRKGRKKAMQTFEQGYGFDDPSTKHHKAAPGIVHAVVDDGIPNRIADP